MITMSGLRDAVERESVTYDALFDVLARERRRYALHCLQQYRNPLALADLADEVALLEHDVESLRRIPEEEVKRIYLNLYHTHIPKMEAASVLEYDQETDSVRLADEFSSLDLSGLL